ncbi:uncharacterized protein LOC109839866 [Asparagus officinalis]|uniref:uncharacterized protein LOC109839866 n=1 Tax=Asparagus officinalis TaxID=4686 RepID=UPI00098E0638|nr:uncharacterized protein LOC109839866 [Asparagus officinalis]
MDATSGVTRIKDLEVADSPIYQGLIQKTISRQMVLHQGYSEMQQKPKLLTLCKHHKNHQRYVVKIIVEDETNSARVALFNAAETLIGCKAQKFIADIKERNNQSSFFQKFVLNIGKIYRFLVKLDENSKDERAQGKIIAQEIQIQEDVTINIDGDDAILKLPKKKIKVPEKVVGYVLERSMFISSSKTVDSFSIFLFEPESRRLPLAYLIGFGSGYG